MASLSKRSVPSVSPLDLTPQDRRATPSGAVAEHVELCAVESLSNFAGPLMQERENNLARTAERSISRTARIQLAAEQALHPTRGPRAGGLTH
jgi:hypothetical protein